MGRFVSLVALAGCIIPNTLALPRELDVLAAKRDLVSSLLGGLNGLSHSSPASPGEKSKTALNLLQGVVPTATPTSPEQALSKLQDIFTAQPTPNNLLTAVGEIVAAGLTTQNINSFLDYIGGVFDGANSLTIVHTKSPRHAVYPRADKSDACYGLSEAALRAAIHIPSTFKYGRGAQPIILVPGTGNTGYETFQGNYIKLLQGSSLADPVWLNIPNQLLSDAQVSAEYVAYAINYIYEISGCRKVAVASWSQGGIISQWAYKYWPSTRCKVTDHVAFSPDYHGTALANLIAIGEPLPASILQQEYESRFIQTLRSKGGDSAYVPTTTIYSGFFDEIVEPQQGTGASAYLLDARHVGVSNNEVQTVCNGQPAGLFYTHEGVLYNNLGYALLKDALTHDGPGRIDRLPLGDICELPLSQGLDLADFLLTENALAIAALSIVVGIPTEGLLIEPSIKSYAIRDAPPLH